MSAHAFHVLIILHANCSPYSSFKDEDFYVVYNGVVVLDINTKIIKIIKKDKYRNDGNKKPKLIICINNVTKIKCGYFHSANRTYQGGSLRLCDTLNQGVEEKVTMKMDTKTSVPLLPCSKNLRRNNLKFLDMLINFIREWINFIYQKCISKIIPRVGSFFF